MAEPAFQALGAAVRTFGQGAEGKKWEPAGTSAGAPGPAGAAGCTLRMGVAEGFRWAMTQRCTWPPLCSLHGEVTAGPKCEWGNLVEGCRCGPWREDVCQGCRGSGPCWKVE